MTEAEMVKDIAAVLAKVPQGVEVVAERDHRAVALIKPSQPEGRVISEVIADLKARGSDAFIDFIDDDFARDTEEGMLSRKLWNPLPGISARYEHPDRDWNLTPYQVIKAVQSIVGEIPVVLCPVTIAEDTGSTARVRPSSASDAVHFPTN